MQKTYKTLVATNENLITALKVKLPKGKVKLTLNSDSVLVADVNFVKAETTANSFTKLSLTTIFKEDNLSVDGGELTYSQSKYQVLNGKVTFSVEEAGKYCGGITIRENYFAHFNNHPTESFYGYLVSVFDNKLRFYKAKYGKTLLVEFPVKEGEITVEFNNEKFDFYNEKGKLIGSYSDKEPYLYGYIGVLSLKGLKLKSFKFEK